MKALGLKAFFGKIRASFRCFLSFKAFPFSLLVLLVFMQSEVYSHPHIFVQAKLKLDFSGERFSGVVQHWEFDELFSAAASADYDSNNNGTLDPAEGQTLWEEVIKPWKKFNYFTNAILNFRGFGPQKASNQSVFLKGDAVVSEFKAEFNGPVASNEWTMILVAIFDPANYVSTEVNYRDIEILHADGLEVEFFDDDASTLPQFSGRPVETHALYVRYRKKS